MLVVYHIVKISRFGRIAQWVNYNLPAKQEYNIEKLTQEERY